MNAIEIQSHTSCTSFSNHNPNEDVCDEKSVLLTPKQHIPNEQHQCANTPKNLNLDLKQQFSSKLKLGSLNDADNTCNNSNINTISNNVKNKIDHHPVLPVRTTTPKRATKETNSVDTDLKNDQPTPRSGSSRSNDSNDVTVSTVASSVSSSTAASMAPVKMKVRFAADRRGNVQCEHFRNLNPKSKQESLDCFYQMHDFQQFRRECKQEAMLQLKTSTYRDNFSKVYAACTTGNFKMVTRERAYISAASCRGLEVVVYPTLHVDRKNTVATVLKTQRALPTTMTDYDERSETIAAASRYLSKQARQLARVLGSGDAAVVIANQRIESLQQQQTQKQPTLLHPSSNGEVCGSSDDVTSQIKQPRRKSNSNVVVPHCFVTC